MEEAILCNVRVLEVAEYAFVPSAAAILADWGADVIKIEHPFRGDSMRGGQNLRGFEPEGFDCYIEQLNRSKRSVGIDLMKPAGRELLLRMVRDSDVVITSLREPVREKLGITCDDLWKVNPRLIYGRGTGQGARGPQSDDRGFDSISYWARSGMAHMATAEGQPTATMPGGGFGDVQAGLALAAGVAAALYRREITGKGSLVDVSLFGQAMWVLFPDIMISAILQRDWKELRPNGSKPGVGRVANPLAGVYETSDHRYVALGMLKADQYWVGFCRAIEREDLIHRPEFFDFAARAENHKALQTIIAEALAAKPLTHWKDVLPRQGCVFGVVQTPLEASQDPQAIANSYLIPHPSSEGRYVISSPVQFNGGAVQLRGPAPGVGEHTDEILLEFGLSQDEILNLKVDDAVN